MLVEPRATLAPVYVLVPAEPLPTIDLSRSVRGELLPARAHAVIHRFLTRYHRLLLLANMSGMVMNTVVTGVNAQSGQILSVISLVMWLPLGLGAPSTLTYDIVRLVMKTFDFWFFSCTTTLTALMISMYFWDLRVCRMMIDWIGFHNIVLIDAQVRGIRPFIIVTILGIPPLIFMLLWIMLGRLDGCTSFSLLSHSNNHAHFSLSGDDIIGNGMITLSLLIIKIVVRKRQTLQLRQKSSMIECVIYRCKLKLDQIQGPTIVHAKNARSKRLGRKHAVAASTSGHTGREPSMNQQMMFIKFPGTFDSNHVIFPLRVAENTLVFLYGVGTVGIVLSFSALANEFSRTQSSGLFIQAWGALFCTIFFVMPFSSLHQRELLKLLVTSFDFFFYAFQATTASLSVCILYDWECSWCLILFTWWIWSLWAFTVDALTPAVRDKLRFRPSMAAPVVALVLLGHITIIGHFFSVGDDKLHDAILFQGKIWNHQLVVRVMPFYFSRIVTLSLWCPRLIWRLSTASQSDVTILRGGVCYDNYFARQGRRRSRLSNPGVRIGSTLKSLVAIKPQPLN
ncbi:hypothetical protein AM587_10007015 [Phytophthora nicotianae]|uniref:Uncharacterized protein n=1 Tax=Phytophthora nicotianae TaxID=4792 RepID=A0A0W8CUJ5_PHYNI|nr:hypothetical protein AM587_10007015 [Phytophthora nicotianae]